MYRILKRIIDNGMESTYMFETEIQNKSVVYKEFETKEEVDEYVESLLNDGVSKKDIEVVDYISYTISADLA